MGKVTGFLEIKRKKPPARPVAERLRDWKEVYLPYPDEELRKQAARCMDCGIPFCHQGCPLGNIIPDWNDLVYKDRWREALDRLHATNNFPEWTGRLCPAPCEGSCVLGINDDAVTIKGVELAIVEHGFDEGWIGPQPRIARTGKRVAVIGSGPMEKDGVAFRPNSHVGVNVRVAELRREFDALVLAGGACWPRDLQVPGRELRGIHFAMEYLKLQNRRCEGDPIPDENFITARDKRVVIIGGGDTGADCLGTVHRQGAVSVHQFELLPRPPDERAPDNPWPQWPNIFRVSGAHEEGGDRVYAVSTQRFTGDAEGRVRQLQAVKVDMVREGGRIDFKPIADSEFTLEVDLVLLAMGFLGAERPGMLSDLGVKLTERGNVWRDASWMTSVPGVFACGDMQRGQSLIVWAIAEGRSAARGVDQYLMGKSDLPAPLA
ncbi:MAG: glutamate synthase [Candidatus Rokuibacteriota bacterium]|nr:MAG: glutamate synthase [Candidatus Rokubacteria bacterium]